ncbi:MAG TPA: hypothetical protein VK988_01655 [Acidimicrobiales bacterium]|nr:hypothetical protein [Acidimicrobiales bacterium]
MAKLDLQVLHHAGRGALRQGFKAASRTVLALLHQLGYSLQANAKVVEGRQHADRDARFRLLNDLVAEFLDDGQPVISVDTRKKSWWAITPTAVRSGPPRVSRSESQVHDFIDPALGKGIPYGAPYDMANNEGWVSVGETADTAGFAVESIRRWWNQLGKARFPDATRLSITADAGGSNGYRLRAWKVHLAARPTWPRNQRDRSAGGPSALRTTTTVAPSAANSPTAGTAPLMLPAAEALKLAQTASAIAAPTGATRSLRSGGRAANAAAAASTLTAPRNRSPRA